MEQTIIEDTEEAFNIYYLCTRIQADVWVRVLFLY